MLDNIECVWVIDMNPYDNLGVCQMNWYKLLGTDGMLSPSLWPHHYDLCLLWLADGLKNDILCELTWLK